MSWNVRGLNKITKLKQVLYRVKHSNAKIVLLQETHLMPDSIPKIQKRWKGQVINASYSTHSRGVILLVHKSIPFEIISTTVDPLGRYVVVQGSLLSEKVNIVNIYGPNYDSPSFFNNLFLTLSSLQGQFIIGGDFNCVLDPQRDRTTTADATHQHSRNTLKHFIQELNLCDVWRSLNPTSSEFSCYSSTHRSYSRIDYFLVSNGLLSRISDCEYEGIAISDHSPISFRLSNPKMINKPPRWRFQTSWLQDIGFTQFLGSQIDFYFETNTTETSATIRWEAFKAFIRGQIISYTSSKKKAFGLKLASLLKGIRELERDVVNDSPEKRQKLLGLRTEYNSLTGKKAAASLLRLKQTYYDQGEKAGKILAWRIKKMETERTINSVQIGSNPPITDPLDINTAFRSFYETLYLSECSVTPDSQKQFLDALVFPSLTEESKNVLDVEIVADEISGAITSMEGGKAAGPDGLPIDIYKMFRGKLIIPLLNMYLESFEKGDLPPSLKSALITLLLKPGKTPTDCGSYRPISLLNTDTKILCKVLAKRLEHCLPNLIYNDQNGFIQGRQAFHNIRRVLNIVHEKEGSQDIALLSLDAEKAFDRIEWIYMFEVLKRFGVGYSFLRWVKLLYTDPTAEILTNNVISSPFCLYRGTRQGCPLSPLLFVLAIEPLAMAVRNSSSLSGIKLGDMDHRISLYADDVVLFLSDLGKSVPALLNLIKTFGEFSGYKINEKKSSILFLNETERSLPTVLSPFSVSNEGFDYLGIKITPKLKDVVPANYDPITVKVADSLSRWSSLPISMIGRINVLKMNIVPKLLYIFQSIPLAPPTSFFKNMEKLFANFVWNNRRARIRLSLLYLPYDRGGLKLPNLQWYYWAAQLRATLFYFSPSPCPAWIKIEELSSTGLPLNLYMYSSDKKALMKNTKNPFLKNSIAVWYTVQAYLGGASSSLSQFSPIWGNEKFTPGRADAGFRIWNNNGLRRISDLYKDGNLMSFVILKDRFDIPSKHFFKFLQVRSFISSSQNKSLIEPPLSVLESVALKLQQGKGQVSALYNILVEHSRESSEGRLLAWREDLQEDVTEEEWSDICLKAQTQTINSQLKLLQYKWITRMYITPVKLNRFNPNIPDVCNKCDQKGTLFHCLWECSKIQVFWEGVLKIIKDITGLEIPQNPKLIVLGVYPENFDTQKNQRALIDICLLQARRMIALSWKSIDAPSLSQYIRGLSSCVAMERLTYIVKKKLEMFETIWGPFMKFLDRVNAYL